MVLHLNNACFSKLAKSLICQKYSILGNVPFKANKLATLYVGRQRISKFVI